MDAAEAAVRAERAHLKSVEQSVLLQAGTDFADVVEAREQLRLARDAAADLQVQAHQIADRRQVGDATRLDGAETELALSKALAEVEQSEIKLQVSEAAYRRDIGHPPESLEKPDLSVSIPSDELEAEDRAIAQNPDVVSAIFAEAQAKANVRDNEGQARPSLTVVGQIQQQRTTASPSQLETVKSVVVQLRLPFYTGGLVASQSRQARDLDDVAKEAIRSAQDTARDNAEASYRQMQRNTAAVDDYKRELAASEEAVHGTALIMLSGTKTILDLLAAKHARLEAEIDIVTADHDRLVATLGLLAAMGDLTAENLSLSASRFDPKAHYNSVHLKWH